MKSFLSNNWYKLMVASSLFIFSIGFFIHAVSPAYANTENTKVTTITNGYYDNTFAVASNGYLYFWNNYFPNNGGTNGFEQMKAWVYGQDYIKTSKGEISTSPRVRKLPL